MYSPVTRLLTVLDLLQGRPSITATQLAERLQVNTRSARRYITMLQDLGIPVEAERGRYGGYRLRPGYKLPPLMWSEDEALAVTLGLRAAQQIGLASQVVGEGEALRAARATAAQLRKFDRQTSAAAKRFIKPIPSEELAREIEIFCDLFSRPTVQSGLKKFVESTDAQPYLP